MLYLSTSPTRVSLQLPQWWTLICFSLSPPYFALRCQDTDTKGALRLKGPPWAEAQRGQGLLGRLFPVLFSHQVVSNSLQPHRLQHAELPCPSVSPRVCSDSCPLSWWCYLTISSSAALFSFCLQSFPALGSFEMNWCLQAGPSLQSPSITLGQWEDALEFLRETFWS